MPAKRPTDGRAQSLRAQQTKSEALLWSILRAKQLCGLKFRRQHPVGPFFADFACAEEHILIEIDGGYHEAVFGADRDRATYMRAKGWQVIRFTSDEVERDAEAVARAIAKAVGRPYEFHRRDGGGAGIFSTNAPSRRSS